MNGGRGKQEEWQGAQPGAAGAQTVGKAKDPQAAQDIQDEVHQVGAKVSPVGHSDEEQHLYPERKVGFHDIRDGKRGAGTQEQGRQTEMIMQGVVEKRRKETEREYQERRKAEGVLPG